MKLRKLLSIGFLFLFSLFLVGCLEGNELSDDSSTEEETSMAAEDEVVEDKETDANEDAIVLRLGHQAPAGTAYDTLAVKFKEYVEERSNGKYSIDIYNGGQLGGDRELMEALQVGNVEFNILTASDMGMFVPEMEVQDLPYLFTTWEEVYAFLDSDVAKEFYAISDEVGITTLSFMPRGFRHTTNNNGPINTPEDMNGLKIRVAESSVYVDTFEAFGASPQSMAWGEVYTALQQGTVDGHENTIVTIVDYKIEEIQDYLSETGHMFGFAAIATNPDWLASLPEEDQEIFQQAAIDAGRDIGALQQQNEEESLVYLEEYGVEINSLDKQPFIDLIQPVYDKYFETHDREWFDKIKAVTEGVSETDEVPEEETVEEEEETEE